MARKKQITIADVELQPTVLAVLRDPKKNNIFSIMWLIVIFSIFIAGVWYLPEISSYVNNYLHPETSTPISGNRPSKNEEEEKNETVEAKEYNLNDNPTIAMDKFNLSNFTISQNQINFSITNTTKEVLDMSKNNYFLNIYSANKKLIQRIMLKDGIISPSANVPLSYDLTDSSASIISVIEIMEDDYPAYNVTPDEYGNTVLTCKKGYETINYTLKENKLSLIQDVFEVPQTAQDYQTLYTNYQANVNSYNNVLGVTSVLSTTNGIMNFNTTIDLATYKEGSISLKTIYPAQTDAKVIKFELEASGYTCN